MSMYNHKPCTTSRRLISLSMLYIFEELSWPWSYGSWIYNYLCNQCLSPLMLWVRILIRAKCTTLGDAVCQLLATGRWFSPGTSVSSNNKTYITEILLKVALSKIKQANNFFLLVLALSYFKGIYLIYHGVVNLTYIYTYIKINYSFYNKIQYIVSDTTIRCMVSTTDTMSSTTINTTCTDDIHIDIMERSFNF